MSKKMDTSSNNLRGRRIVGQEYLTGTVLQDEADSTGANQVLIALSNGTHVRVAANLLVAQPDGSYYLPLSSAALAAASATAAGAPPLVIPVIEEEVTVEKQQVERGRVRIHKLVEQRDEQINEALLREDVAVERVAVNTIVDTAPEPHYDGDTLVIPLLEEVLVVEKRLLVREEVRVTRRKTTVPYQQTVTLRREHVEVERLAADTSASESGSEHSSLEQSA